MLPGIKNYAENVNDILNAFEDIEINLNMENSTINKLFAKNKQSILGLLKFGTTSL